MYYGETICFWSIACIWFSQNDFIDFIVTINHSLCAGRATGCSNVHVAAKRRRDKLLRVVCRMFVKIFVSATEFRRCNNTPCTTYLLWQQNSVAETVIFTEILWYTRSDARFVAAATCGQVRIDLFQTTPPPHRCANLNLWSLQNVAGKNVQCKICK